MDNVYLDVAVNLELEAVKLDDLTINKHISKTISDLFPEAPGVTEALENTIRFEPGQTLLHKNLMHYLTLAWYNHFSVVISPDMIFYTILCELAEQIKSDPDAYRHLFTDSTDKKEIITVSNNNDLLDLNQVIAALSKNIAVDATLFTAEFSTTNPESRLAIQAAFCDAMSPYYSYGRTRCGIPRIKILGTKEDWTTLEKKLYTMATEVFRGEINSVEDEDYEEPRIVSYLKRALEVVQKIHTETSSEYWSEMYKIDKCRSGHTNYVVGWINSLYRSYHGNDFYNYQPHISIVAYRDLDSQKDYELRSGLLYSSIEKGTSDLDQKFPWLVPHFAHVVWDKSVKMTADQYRTYVDKSLDGTHYNIFNNFFDILKENPMVLASGSKKIKQQRFEILGRQLDLWIAHPEQTTQVDFSLEKFQDIFTSFTDHSEPVTEVFLSKMKTVFDTCHIRSVNLTGGEYGLLKYIEDKLVHMLIGKPELEDLAIEGYSVSTEDASLKVLYDLLLHPQCNLKSLKISGEPFEGDSIALAKAFLNMERPLAKIELQKIADKELADAILELATKGSLKRFYCGMSRNKEIDKKVLLIMARAPALEDALIFSIQDESQSEIYEELAKNLPLHNNLTTVKVTGRNFDEQLLTRMLSIPSLQRLEIEDATTNFAFLSHTPLLQYLKARGGSQGALGEFVKSDTCQLKELDIWITYDELDSLGAGLVQNKSLPKLQINVSKEKDRAAFPKFGEFLAVALENGIPLRILDVGCYLRIEPEEMIQIVKAATHHPYLEKVVIELSEIVSEEGIESVIDLVQTNKVLKEFHVSNYASRPEVKWTEEQKKRLIDALEQSDTLTGFSMTSVWSSHFKLKNENS